MDVSDPARVALSRVEGAVVGVVARVDASFTVREIARLAGVSHGRAAEVVRRLEEHGLLLVETVGRAYQVRFNREHLAAEALLTLVTLRDRLLALLRKELGGWRVPAVHASLFGSAARGDGHTSSDLDVLVVRRESEDDSLDTAWVEQMVASARRVERATGNAVAWLELTADDVARAVSHGEPIVEAWRSEAIDLVGESIRALLARVGGAGEAGLVGGRGDEGVVS